MYKKCDKIEINGKNKIIYSKQNSKTKYIKHKNEMISISKYKKMKGGDGCGIRDKSSLDQFAYYWWNVLELNLSWSDNQSGYFFSNGKKILGKENIHVHDCSNYNEHTHIYDFYPIQNGEKIHINYKIKRKRNYDESTKHSIEIDNDNYIIGEWLLNINRELDTKTESMKKPFKKIFIR